MIATAGAIVALLVGMQSLGVFNHVDTFAWSSDIAKLAQAQLGLTRQQLQDEQSFFAYQMNQASSALATNQALQYQYRLKREPVPSALIDQASQLQNVMRDLQQRIQDNQRKLQ